MEFFGMTEESTFSELLQEESFLRKMKNYCCSPIIHFINRNPEPNNTEKESKPCNHLLDLYRRNFLGDEERSINSTHSKTTTNPGSVRGDDERSINSTHSKTTTNPGSVRDRCEGSGDGIIQKCEGTDGDWNPHQA